ncbi:RNA-binding domain-containing protein [Odoribacter sp. AF15-53]|uniref:RNA-binding domain-containing protein n=1 Tax=Odoribacter sp. AF15-53 TaxID=2292236 RepID=UPI0013145E56|nr:RNA-binding domain-containing protein [Odoribacter sp. AF15-53]
MQATELKKIIQCGETSTVQFKERFSSQKQLAAEMIAFANSKGGIIILGVEDKTGAIKGLTYEEIQNTASELGNTANEQVRPVIYLQTDVVIIDEHPILIAYIEEGINKPYKDLNGNIWVKQGADKRRITENCEILRLFHYSHTYTPDEEPVIGTSEKDLDGRLIDTYIRKVYHKEKEDFGMPYEHLLQNLRIMDESKTLTLSGLLYFGKHPQQYKPSFMIKAVAFYGNDIAGTQYRDSKDIEGTIPELFEQGMAFLKSNLHHIQAGQSFNSIGKLEISEIALEETLQNALVHREYIKTAAIRLLIFDDRVEIISPGCLPDGLTVEDIKLGNSYQRNQQIANFCAKTMVYRGLGSGIIRALKEDVHIDFINNESGNQFTTILYRNKVTTNLKNEKTNLETNLENEKTNLETKITSLKTTQERLLDLIQKNPTITRQQLADHIGLTIAGVKYHLAKMSANGLIKHEGSTKKGYWIIISSKV